MEKLLLATTVNNDSSGRPSTWSASAAVAMPTGMLGSWRVRHVTVRVTCSYVQEPCALWNRNSPMNKHHAIGLYRDVWIAAIASSRTRLATLTGAMCKTPQCELRSLRVNSGMLNVIRIVTYYTLPPLESPYSFWIAMAISR